MQEVRTFCRVCEPSCNLIAEVENNEITKLRPGSYKKVSNQSFMTGIPVEVEAV